MIEEEPKREFDIDELIGQKKNIPEMVKETQPNMTI